MFCYNKIQQILLMSSLIFVANTEQCDEQCCLRNDWTTVVRQLTNKHFCVLQFLDCELSTLHFKMLVLLTPVNKHNSH